MATNIKIEDILNDLKLEKNDQDGINAVAVIGLGVMGQGIAQTIAAHGIEVVAIEKNEKQLETMTSILKESMDDDQERKELDAFPYSRVGRFQKCCSMQHHH